MLPSSRVDIVMQDSAPSEEEIKSSELSERVKSFLLPGLAFLCVISFISAAVLGKGWWDARASKDLADQREAAATDAIQAVTNINSFDFGDPAASLDAWAGSITGNLAKDIQENRDIYLKNIVDTGYKAKSVVTKLGFVEFNVDEGDAKALVSLSVLASSPTGQTTTSQLTQLVTLDRVAEVWKVAESELLATVRGAAQGSGSTSAVPSAGAQPSETVPPSAVNPSEPPVGGN
ncbi:MAG: hypothetical protein ACRCSF_00600 [Mycobacteriaceae bacterium]